MSFAPVRILLASLFAAAVANGCSDPGPPPGGTVAQMEQIEIREGQAFDSSVERGEPFVFPLGAGRVIRGWDEGVAGMRVGGQRELRIPAEMAYGRRGAGGVIPPNASLVFEVELLEVRKGE